MADLAEDQQYIREQLPKLGLCAFVANGSILPEGIRRFLPTDEKQRPVSVAEGAGGHLDAAPSEENLRGMGIQKGITLIVGGGYHGKSTLLKALELGVYNHIAGDGREYVITDETAVKIRAEDGRSITEDGYFHVYQRPAQRNGYRGAFCDGGRQRQHVPGGQCGGEPWRREPRCF